MRGDGDFKDKCRAIIVEWLKQLRRKADIKAASKSFVYKKIVFTVPFNWTKPFQDIYLDMIADAFPEHCAADEGEGVAEFENITIMCVVHSSFTP